MKGLPVSPRTRAFRAVVAAIRESPALRNSRVVKSWRVWDGTGNVGAISTDQMPLVRLSLLGGPVERIATLNDSGQPDGIPSVDIECQPLLLVETWVGGTNVDDAMDLAEAIDVALFPPDQPSRAKLVAALLEVGISDWMPSREVLPENLADYDAACIRSVGSYRLTLTLTQ